MAADVWFGVHTPPEGLDFEHMRSICLRVEELGYDLFTITDHFMNMANPNGPSRHPLECWTTLAGLASITQRIKLGSLVSCYAYRAPTVLAKMATTVDIISTGRLIFGIGAGWHEEEFKGFLGRFPPARERLRGLEETVEICKRMFTSERTTYRGKLFRVENALNSPQPVQKPLPMMIGGGGEKRTLRIAARHADISHFPARNLEEVERRLAALRRHCGDVGRDYDDIRKGVNIGVVIGRDRDETEAKLRRAAEVRGTTVDALRSRVGLAFGTSEEVAEVLGAYISRGIGLITAIFYNLDDITPFAEGVIPLIS